jgi:hypothetical protein
MSPPSNPNKPISFGEIGYWMIIILIIFVPLSVIEEAIIGTRFVTTFLAFGIFLAPIITIVVIIISRRRK